MTGFLTVEEAAQQLRVSHETIRRYLRSGRLHGMGGGHRRRWLIPAASIAAMLGERDVKLDFLTDQKIIQQVQEIRAEASRLAEKAATLEKMLTARYK